MAVGTENSFENLVPISCTKNPNLFRINPGDDDAIYLDQQISPGGNIGQGTTRMPFGGSESSYLSDGDIQIIENWIKNGQHHRDRGLVVETSHWSGSPRKRAQDLETI